MVTLEPQTLLLRQQQPRPKGKEWQNYAEELEDEIKHLKKAQAKAAAAAAKAEKETLKYEKAFEYSSEQFRKSTTDGLKKDSIIKQKDAEMVSTTEKIVSLLTIWTAFT